LVSVFPNVSLWVTLLFMFFVIMNVCLPCALRSMVHIVWILAFQLQKLMLCERRIPYI
jgi:hypothetical protein